PLRFRPERKKVTVPVFREEGNRIRAEQLVVADGRRNRASPGPIRHETGLRIVGTVATGLEGVDADNLVAGEPACECGLCVCALEITIACRSVRHEAELVGGVLEKICNHWNLGPLRRRSIGIAGINRPRWSRINWWLRQDIVVERNWQMVATL